MGADQRIRSANSAARSGRSGAGAARSAILVVILLSAASFFSIGLRTLPLFEPDEGRNAEVAREMIVSHDWITPHYDSLDYLDKPAEYFWMVASSFRVFGASEGAARLPSLLAALATLCLLWLLAGSMFPGASNAVETHSDGADLAVNRSDKPARDRRYSDVGLNIRLKGAIVFATLPLVFHFAHIVILDMPLTFFLTAAMSSFWLAAASGFERRRFEIVFFAAMGLACFEKGPVGMILPLLSILVYQAVRGRVRELRKLHWGAGTMVFLATALPWYVLISLLHPDYPRYAVFYETLARFATGHAHRGGGIFYYVGVYLAGFLPWSLFLLFALGNRVKRWKALRQEHHKAELYLTAWMVVIFLFFSLSHSKLPGYVLPAAVPFSLLMARFWQRDVDAPNGRAPDWLTAGFAVLILLGIIIAGLSRWPGLLGARLAGKIPPLVLPMLSSTVLMSGVILAALGFLGRNASHRLGTPSDLDGINVPGLSLTRRSLRSAIAFATVAVVLPLLLLRWTRPLEVYADAESSRSLARAIQASPQKDLPIYGFYYFRTGLPYYLGRPVGLVTTGATEMTSNYVISRMANLRQRKLETGFALMITSAELTHLSETTSKPFLVMVRNEQVRTLTETVGAVEPLWTSWPYSIVEVPAAGSKYEGTEPAMIDKVLRR